MLSSPRALVSGAAALLALYNVAAAVPQVPISEIPTPTVPAHCSTTVDDWEHTTAWVSTHECYAYTRVAPASTCPTLSCASKPPGQVCPSLTKASYVTAPCSTDCCPTTTTSYVSTGGCPICDPCPIPTEWVTFITGCPGMPTITSITIETPPWIIPDDLEN